MRPSTLKQAADRIAAGEAIEKALSEFLDGFYLAPTSVQRRAMILDEPPLSGDDRLDGLLGAVAEYLAHHYEVSPVPHWVFGPKRYLEHAWHTSPFADAGFREYLTFASPAEFSSRNIFTEESPLRRARSGLGGIGR